MRIFDGLSTLKAIPHASLLEVVLNEKLDRLANDIDVVVHAEFASQADLEAYKAHPIYLAAIDKVRPLRDLRIAVDYVIPNPDTDKSSA